jgi:hypothetical protein
MNALRYAVPVAAALVALRGVFTVSRVFFIRDLSAYFWPVHVWFTRTVAARESLLWDPYFALGSPAIADPVRQILFPPAVALRLLLPETLGFNLLVALPFPIAAAGACLLLRRHVGPWAASLGATVFSLSGAVLSTANMPNLSWSVALTPWTLWAAKSMSACGRTSSTPQSPAATTAVAARARPSVANGAA